MKAAIIRKTITVQKNRIITKEFLKSIITPVISGIYGFSLLLIFFIIGKFISYLVGNNSSFSVDLEIVAISIIGFVLFFLIKMIEVLRGMKH